MIDIFLGKEKVPGNGVSLKVGQSCWWNILYWKPEIPVHFPCNPFDFLIKESSLEIGKKTIRGKDSLVVNVLLIK